MTPCAFLSRFFLFPHTRLISGISRFRIHARVNFVCIHVCLPSRNAVCPLYTTYRVYINLYYEAEVSL